MSGPKRHRWTRGLVSMCRDCPVWSRYVESTVAGRLTWRKEFSVDGGNVWVASPVTPPCAPKESA